MFLVETDVGYFKENYFVHNYTPFKTKIFWNFPQVQEQAANSSDVQKTISPTIGFDFVRSKHIKGLKKKKKFFIGSKHNLQSLGVMPFVKLQNYT